MSFAEHKPRGAWPLDGIGVSMLRAGGALKVHVSIGPDAAAALGVAGGDRVAVLVGTGADAGSLRLKRVERGGRKLRRPRVKGSGKAGTTLKLVTAPWPGLPDGARRMERRPFTRVGAGEIELVLPAFEPTGAPPQPKAAPEPAARPKTTRPDPTPPETPPRASAAAPTTPAETTPPKVTTPKTTRPKTTRVKTARLKTRRLKTGRPKPAKASNAMPRVSQVADLVKRGFVPAAIAEDLGLKLSTVGYYIHAARKAGLLAAVRRKAQASARSRRAVALPPSEAPGADEGEDRRDSTAELTGKPGWEPDA